MSARYGSGVLLGGIVLVAVPIVIHLSVRRRPRRQIFPALRLVQLRSKTNRRRLRVRQLWLLALRVLAVLLAVLLLARPAVAVPLVADWILIGLLGGGALLIAALAATAWAVRRAPLLVLLLLAVDAALWIPAGLLLASVLSDGSPVPLGDARAPVSAAILVDTSPRMTYVHENQPRLGHARHLAKRIIGALPPESQIAVVGQGTGTVFWTTGRRGAAAAIDQLERLDASPSLPQQVLRALRLLKEARHPRHELYVITDATVPGWPKDAAEATRRACEEDPSLTTYVLDAGVEHPVNVYLGDVKLSTEWLAGSGSVELAVTLDAVGRGGTRTVEVWLERPDVRLPLRRNGQPVAPPARLVDRTTLRLAPGKPIRHVFRVAPREPGTYHGKIRVRESDPLEADNERYFTVVVRPPWKMLVVAGAGTSAAAWVEAVAPKELRRRGAAAFDIQQLPVTQLGTTPLEPFDVLVLLDPPRLEADIVKRIEGFVRAGGAAVISLGPNFGSLREPPSDAWNELLGARLALAFRRQETFVAPQSYEHPILRPFRDFASKTPWSDFPVDTHLGIDTEAPASVARVVLRYANGEPFLLEHALGEGRVVWTTTPVTEVPYPKGRRAWNRLAGPNDWPRFILVNEMAAYAAGETSTRWNYEVGESAVLPNNPERHAESYQLAPPVGPLQTLRAGDGQLRIPWLEHAGHYRLKGIQRPDVLRGLSANLPAAASDLRRRTPEELAQFFPADRFQIARDLDELSRQQDSRRTGREFYPFLAVLLALLLATEQILADRFYGAPAPALAGEGKPSP